MPTSDCDLCDVAPSRLVKLLQVFLVNEIAQKTRLW